MNWSSNIHGIDQFTNKATDDNKPIDDNKPTDDKPGKTNWW